MYIIFGQGLARQNQARESSEANIMESELAESLIQRTLYS